MLRYALGGLFIALLLLLAIAKAWFWVAEQRFLIALAKFATGHRKDRKPGRHKRALRNLTAFAAAAALVAGLLADPVATEWAALHIFMSVSALLFWVPCEFVWNFWFRYKWLRPAHKATHRIADIDHRRKPHHWLSADRERSWVRAQLPAGWTPDDQARKALVSTLTAKFALDAPDVAWRLAGPKPMLALTAAEPPPTRVTLDGIKADLERAQPDELVWGRGKRGVLVTTSLSGDSPHAGLSMGSGAGKSITARSLLAQMLYRGCVGVILDCKMISHQWARNLPNVMIYRRPHEIHDALLWLAREVDRRNEVAEAGSDDEGNVHAVVGARFIVVCEELNATMSKLRTHWRQERHEDKSLPARSPALDALDFVNLTGRQALVNLIYMGQRLSVKAIGGDGDARESIGVVALGRYKQGAWKMLAGDFPMPSTPLTPGRMQVVTDKVREAQGVFMTAREAQALAVAGEVAPLPYDMPGAPRVTGSERTPISSPDQDIVTVTAPISAPPVTGLVTLSQAISEGVLPAGTTYEAVKQALWRDKQRPEIERIAPPVRGHRGTHRRFDPVELAEFWAGRR